MTRVIIVAPNWLGDAVMALPAIADLRRGLPDATIAVAAKPAVASLFGLIEHVDEVVEKGTAQAGQIALLLPNSFRAAFEAARARIPERWGYRTDCRGPLLTRGVPRAPAGLHQVDYYQRLVRALGFANGPAQPHVELRPEIRAAGERALRQAGWDGAAPLLAMAPGAAFGSAKRWPPACFAALARQLSAGGLRVALVGSAADEPSRRAIEAALGPDRALLLNLVGQTDVPTLAGVLSHARAIVANDSGPMHLGAALGVPTAALFGPTSEKLTAPRSIAATEVLTHPVWCRPCMLRECPLDHECMRGTAVVTVAAAARRLM
jgi:lipopolysaccharide heptosyltransferase II